MGAHVRIAQGSAAAPSLGDESMVRMPLLKEEVGLGAERRGRIRMQLWEGE